MILHIGRKEMHTEFLSGNFKEGDHEGGLGVDRKVILK
jgi:hypothetical protein